LIVDGGEAGEVSGDEDEVGSEGAGEAEDGVFARAGDVEVEVGEEQELEAALAGAEGDFFAPEPDLVGLDVKAVEHGGEESELEEEMESDHGRGSGEEEREGGGESMAEGEEGEGSAEGAGGSSGPAGAEEADGLEEEGQGREQEGEEPVPGPGEGEEERGDEAGGQERGDGQEFEAVEEDDAVVEAVAAPVAEAGRGEEVAGGV
jgi:hypothetical protein